MNNEAKTKEMTSGQALQLVSVIAQSLGKIGLDFGLAKLLIDKPSITRRRLKALTGENPNLIVPHYQYATIERLDVNPENSHHYEGDADYLTLNKDLEGVLTAPGELAKKYGTRERPRNAHRCDVIRTLREDEGLYPVFREALMYQGNDGGMWRILYERRAYWTIQEVLGFVYDEIHEGDSQLGLAEHSSDIVFPVLITDKMDTFFRKKTYDRVGALLVSQSSLLREKRKWNVSLHEGQDMLQFHRKTIYFANDPRFGEK